MKALQKVERKLSKLGGASDNGSASTAKPGRKRRRWKLSARTRAKMRANALARYRKNKAEEAQPKTRKLSAAGRVAISSAQKARWTKLKAEQTKAEA